MSPKHALTIFYGLRFVLDCWQAGRGILIAVQRNFIQSDPGGVADGIAPGVYFLPARFSLKRRGAEDGTPDAKGKTLLNTQTL